jgi:hypothetical protein
MLAVTALPMLLMATAAPTEMEPPPPSPPAMPSETPPASARMLETSLAESATDEAPVVVTLAPPMTTAEMVSAIVLPDPAPAPVIDRPPASPPLPESDPA